MKYTILLLVSSLCFGLEIKPDVNGVDQHLMSRLDMTRLKFEITEVIDETDSLVIELVSVGPEGKVNWISHLRTVTDDDIQLPLPLDFIYSFANGVVSMKHPSGIIFNDKVGIMDALNVSIKSVASIESGVIPFFSDRDSDMLIGIRITERNTSN